LTWAIDRENATRLSKSELLGMKWSDIDFERSETNVRRAVVYGVVGHCRSKASQKPVALDPVLAETLRNWRLNTPYNKPDDWGFASTKLNRKKPLTPGMLRKWHLKPAAKEAEVPGKIGWHTFRRTLASLFTADGVDVKTVQESLRHQPARSRWICTRKRPLPTNGLRNGD
jgi:integrase